MRPILIALALLVGCDGDSDSKPRPNPGTAWEIDKRAVGVSAPVKVSDGTAFVIPLDGGFVNYVTRPGSLKGKVGMTLRYRIEAADGVQIMPKDHSGNPSQLALYFQRCGDNWTARGEYETYRWYSAKRVMPITPGVGEISARFDEPWGAILTSTSATDPAGFREALSDTCRVGFVLGGGNTGVGHGVYATDPAIFVITGFDVQ